MDAIGSVLFVITAAIAIYGLRKGWFEPGTEAALAGEPKLTISQAKSGQRAKVIGTASALGPLMKSPIGERECIGFRSIIRMDDGDTFMTVCEKEACDPVVISDDTAPGARRRASPVRR